MRKRASSTCGMPSSRLMILMGAGFRDMAFSLGRNEKGSHSSTGVVWVNADQKGLPQAPKVPKIAEIENKTYH
jgi:hypothetical protein